MSVRLPILLTLALGCAPEEDDRCARPTPLTEPGFGRPFVDRYCTGCHSSLLPEGYRNAAPLGVDLDRHADLEAWAERIAARTLDGTMPPGGGPTTEELAQLEEWLICDGWIPEPEEP